jgi:hypothetical protein
MFEMVIDQVSAPHNRVYNSILAQTNGCMTQAFIKEEGSAVEFAARPSKKLTGIRKNAAETYYE